MSPPVLVLVDGGERFPIEGDVTIGRSEADIVVEDDLVSRRHASVTVTPGGLEIEDLGSRNGTRVNGKTVEQRQTLREGDVVQIGEVELRVEGLKSLQVTRQAAVIQATREAPIPQGLDKPEPEVPAKPAAPVAPPMPKAPPPSAETGEQFQSGPARRRSSGPSAARRGSATLVAFTIILATAGGLVAYFADRGL